MTTNPNQDPIFTEDERAKINKLHDAFLETLKEHGKLEQATARICPCSYQPEYCADLSQIIKVQNRMPDICVLVDRVDELEKMDKVLDKSHNDLSDRVDELEKFVENLQRSVGKFITDFGS